MPAMATCPQTKLRYIFLIKRCYAVQRLRVQKLCTKLCTKLLYRASIVEPSFAEPPYAEPSCRASCRASVRRASVRRASVRVNLPLFKEFNIVLTKL